MKLFSDCSGECCVCICGGGLCLAGHGDDNYSPATKEQVIERLDNDKCPSYRQVMIQYLKEKFDYDY